MLWNGTVFLARFVILSYSTKGLRLPSPITPEQTPFPLRKTMKTKLHCIALLPALFVRASGVAALGDIACGVYTNGAATGIPFVENDWLDGTVCIGHGGYTPAWWTAYGVTEPNAAPMPDAAATMGQLKWCVSRTAALLDNVAMNVGGAGSWLSWTAANLPSYGNDEAVTVADFAELAAPVVSRVQELAIDSMYTPPEAFPGISALFDYGSHSNEPVSIAHVRDIFNFDPEIDSYMDGIPDWWQRYYGLISWSDYGNTDPDVDFDLDGLSDLGEWLAGSDPSLRDTDGDGLVDGADPDPVAWTNPADANGNGLPDAYETHWFGAPDASLSPSTPLGDGFTLGTKMAAGLCPTGAVPESVGPSAGNDALLVVPRFSVEVEAGAVVWERTFELERHGAWEEFFVSCSPDPLADGYAADVGAWSLDGLSLEWSDDLGASGSAQGTSVGSPFRLPLSAPADGSASLRLTLRLRATASGLVSCPRSLHLLSYAPTISFPGLPSALFEDARLFAAASTNDVAFSIDRSLRPSVEDLGADEKDALPFAAFGRDPDEIVRGYDGSIVSGVFHGLPAGVFEIPAAAAGSPPARRTLLAVLSPRLTFGTGHAPDASGLSWDPASDSYARASDFPLDTGSLWRAFHSDATGGYSCDCVPELWIGLPDPYDALFSTNVVVSSDDGIPCAEATVSLSGVPVWDGAASHLTWSLDSPDPLSEGEGSCGCETCDDLDGPKLGSLGFRLVLGQPRAGQLSGFAWFRSEGPVAVTPALFRVLARSDAAVSDSTAAGARTIACSDERGRTVSISSTTNGVEITVTDTATGGPDHSWTISNENADPARIRFVRTSRAGNTMLDRTFVFSAGNWTELDPVAGTTETLLLSDALSDPVSPTGAVERVLADASGLPLSHTLSLSRRYGAGPAAILREVERREDVGTPFEKASFATYWEDGGARVGLPRLLSGSARAWSWTDYDDLGRPVLVFDQRDGSACPADGTGWTLASHPAFAAFATVSDYTPLVGDAARPEDGATPRTVSRYVVDGTASTLISRTWTVVSVGTASGIPTVSVRTERAASQTAAFGDPANAVSLSVSFDPDAPGVPLLLRGRPVSSADEDGVTTAHEYAFGSWDPAARTFAEGVGASHLRTRSRTTTPEAPDGIPLVSTVSETVEDAVHGDEVWSATRVLLADGSLSEPFDWEARVYDEKDRLRSTLYADGSSSTNAYSCCRLLFTVGRDGLRRERLADTGTDHLRHAWLDVSFASLPKNQSNDYLVPQTYDYSKPGDFRAVKSSFDPLGRETSRRTMSTRPRLATSIGSLRPAPGTSAADYWWESSETNAYPHGTSDHRIHVDARGLRTETSVYRYPSSDETWTDTYDGTNLLERAISCTVRGGETESYRAWDGAWTSTRSLSLHGADGRRTDLSVTESSDGPVVTNSLSVSDLLGRTVRVVTPLSDATYAYVGASSRLLSVSDARSGLTTTTLYDELRQPVGSLGSDGVSSLSSTRYERDASNALWRVTETREAAGSRTNLLSTVRERLTGLSDALRSETVFVPAGGPASRTTVSFDPASLVSVETNLVDGLAPLVRRSKFGRVFETRERDGTVRSSFFDPYGRPYLAGETPPGGTFAWRTWTYRDALGDAIGTIELAPASVASSGLATNHWSSLWGSGIWRGLLTERTFDRRGSLVASWDPAGNATYHERDSLGRLVGSFGATYPVSRTLDSAGRLVALCTTRDGSAWDVTAWAYDPATGLCTNKAYADGSRVTHTFDAAGRPLRTTLASGRWTENVYDAAGRLHWLRHSDSDDDVAYAYDAFGRLLAEEDDLGFLRFARDNLGRVTNECRTTGGRRPVVLSSLARPLDAFGRPAGYRLEIAGDFSGAIGYTWGMDGKLASLALTNAAGRTLSVSLARAYGRPAGWTISDAEGELFFRSLVRAPRRPDLVTSCRAAGPSRWIETFSYAYDALGRPVSRNADSFAYNERGEVTNAAVSSFPAAYAYDPIGNRTAASDLYGAKTYAANAVNQYVSVGASSPSYDADGNLLSWGLTTYAWNAAGRLASVAWHSGGLGDLGGGGLGGGGLGGGGLGGGGGSPTRFSRFRNEYDGRGRRTRRILEKSVDGGSTWTLSETREFLYDDWNLIHETRTDAESGDTTEIEYYWGPDLSDTLQGAGGVGGLVAVSVDGAWYFPDYDANGNVTAYRNETRGYAAQYAYDAFGNMVLFTGPMASFFAHGFSTKYYDFEPDLYYYGYRFYSPVLGRWISRDPIGERGGVNVFVYCRNSIPTSFDKLGLQVFVYSAAYDNDQAEDPRTGKTYAELYSESIRNGCDFVNTVQQFVRSIPDTKFREYVNNDQILLDGKPFKEGKQEYLRLLHRECSSKFISAETANPDSLISSMRLDLPLLFKSYDQFAVLVHGSLDESEPLPRLHDELQFVGQDGKFHHSREHFLRRLEEIRLETRTKGSLVFISCYQDWETIGNDLSLTLEQRKAKAKEHLEILPPTLAQDIPPGPSDDPLGNCKLDFIPFKVLRQHGDLEP